MPDIASLTTGAGNTMYEATERDIGGMTQSDFLELLIVQLQHQDPMEPQDSQDFASQLAEFTSLEELQNLNSTSLQGVETNLMLAQTINNTMTATMIGKETKAIGDVINIKAPGQETQLDFDLGLPADTITVSIRDSAGTLVKTINMDPLPAGENSVTWDGTNSSGADVLVGEYNFSVVASNLAGELIAVDTILYGTIDAVSYGTGGAIFIVNGREVPFSAVLEIAQPTSPVVIDTLEDQEDPEHSEGK